MEWKEAFKPTKKKVLTFLFISFIWWLILVLKISRIRYACLGTCDYDFPSLLHSGCSCSTLSSNIIELIEVATPGFLYYILTSLIQKFRNK